MLLFVPASELEPPEGATLSPDQRTSGPPSALREATRAAFWRQWSAGKPVLVRDVKGKVPWVPAVRTACFGPVLF